MAHCFKALLVALFIVQIHGEDITCGAAGTTLQGISQKLQNLNDIQQSMTSSLSDLTKNINIKIDDVKKETSLYPMVLFIDGCANEPQKQMTTALNDAVNKLKPYIDMISKLVTSYTTKVNDLQEQYKTKCPKPDDICDATLAKQISENLTSITTDVSEQNKKKEEMATQKTSAETEATNTVVKALQTIFSCLLKDKYSSTNSSLASLAASLVSNNHEIDLEITRFRSEAAVMGDRFNFTLSKLKEYDDHHKKHNLTKCLVFIDLEKKLTEAEHKLYENFTDIKADVKKYNESMTSNFTDYQKNIGQCQDSKCVDVNLKQFEAKKNDLDAYKVTIDKQVKERVSKAVETVKKALEKNVEDVLSCCVTSLTNGSESKFYIKNNFFYVIIGLLVKLLAFN